VATFTDADRTDKAIDFVADIDWGDGVVSEGTIAGGNGSFSVTGQHAYPDEGSYPVSVNVRPAGASVVAVLSTAVVGDAPLTVTPRTVSGIEGVAFSGVVATIIDANAGSPAADFTASIDWGDGSAASAAEVTLANGTLTVASTHTYAEE